MANVVPTPELTAHVDLAIALRHDAVDGRQAERSHVPAS
jgi:hypothetical protein